MKVYRYKSTERICDLRFEIIKPRSTYVFQSTTSHQWRQQRATVATYNEEEGPPLSSAFNIIKITLNNATKHPTLPRFYFKKCY